MAKTPLPPGDDPEPAPSTTSGESDNTETPAVVPPDFDHPGADAP